MLYPFMTLEDETEIVHSEPLTVDGKEKVKVVIEQPVTGGFHSAVCWLPDYTWEKIEGFSKEEINQYQEFIESVSHVIIELARDLEDRTGEEGLLYNIHYQMNPEHVMKTGHDYAAVLQKKIDVMEY